MADIQFQSATAEIKQGKKEKEETTGQKYNGLPYSIERPSHYLPNSDKKK